MGWSYEYLKGISKANQKDKCPKSEKGKSHKSEFWFGSLFCKRCGINLE